MNKIKKILIVILIMGLVFLDSNYMFSSNYKNEANYNKENGTILDWEVKDSIVK